MMKLASYPEYKDSGQPFLGEIPAHWDLFRNGRLFSQRNETGFGELPILEVSLKTGVRVRDMENLKRKQVMSDKEKYKRAAQGDIAYNMMRMWQGAVGVAPVDGLVSPAYVVVRPFPEVDCRYFSYLFRTASYMNEVDAYSRGIVKDRNRLYWQDFKRMPSPVPPVEEQRHIARFLDAVNSKVQRFIRNKRRLIELLKEQKQNVINQAVTRGLDPKVKFKPSGVEWIGDIPGHWEVRRLKYLTDFLNGIAFKPGDWKDNGIPIIRIQNLNGSEAFNYTDREDLPDELLVQRGDILFAWSGNKGTSFGSFMWDNDYPAYLNQHIFKLREFKLHSRYFYYQLRAVTRHVEEQAQGIIGLVHITKPELGAIYVPLPDISEQAQIAAYLDSQFATINQAITRAQREIELMREYRTRLISDVVTGQVDVRNMQVPEVAEEEMLALEEDTADADADAVINDEGEMDETD